MAIVLTDGEDTVSIPDTGALVWSDERQWSPVVQATHHCFGGQFVVQSAARISGQPLTLTGGEPWAVVRQDTLDALLALVAPAGVQLTVTLDDDRAYTCTPSWGQGPAVASRPVPQVGDSGLVESDAATLHWLDAVRLLILAGPLE
jgi:hypothetical protein